jgi:putative aldouronate transport system substrate-binding protein
MNNQRRLTLLGMTSIVLSLSLVASGCGRESDSGITPKASVKTAKSEAGDNPIEITWANNFSPPETDDNYVQKQLEQKFNVKIKNVKFDRSGWKDKFNLLLATGQIPDIFPIDADETDMAAWADQGIIASISPDEIRQNMPNFTKALESIDDGAWNVGFYNGKNWGIPKVWPAGNSGLIPGYNEAWLKKIGYNEPPKTLAELEDVLTKFTYNDPDGNGKKDTYGMSGRGKLPSQMFTSVFSAYGVSPYQFKLSADGKVVFGGITEETRSALKLLNKWFNAGLIDPEFITADNGQLEEKFANQKIGMVDNMGWSNFDADSKYIKKAALDKGQHVIAGKPVIGPAGKAYAFSYGARQAPVLLGVQLEKDEAKRAKIEQILEYVATNPEGWLLTVYGEKGVSYEMNGGFVVAGPTSEASKVGAGGFYNPLYSVDTSMEKYNTTRESLNLKAKLDSGYEPLRDVIGPTVLTSKAKYGASLQTLVDNYLVKAIIGKADTDKGFDDFKANWLKSGGQELTDEVNKVYAQRQKK